MKDVYFKSQTNQIPYAKVIPAVCKLTNKIIKTPDELVTVNYFLLLEYCSKFKNQCFFCDYLYRFLNCIILG